MKSPFVLPRIALAITLILVITLFPHHHHNGDHLCWTIEQCETEGHCPCPKHENEQSTPCNDQTCSLQATKFFIQGERPSLTASLLFVGHLPDVLSLDPDFLWIENRHIAQQSNLPLTRKVLTRTLRGPPLG